VIKKLNGRCTTSLHVKEKVQMWLTSICAPKSWHYNQLDDCGHYQAEETETETNSDFHCVKDESEKG
jgi:hypothetical protein